MADALDSARAKLARANLHAGVAKRETRRFIDKHPSPSIRVEQKTNPKTLELGRTLIDLDIVFADDRPGIPDLPSSFSARFGDAIQNYRSALDHVAWQLVKHGTDPDPERPTLVQFPICTRQADFRDQLATRLPGVDDKPGGPCEFIEAYHRYDRGNAQNDVLLRLAQLSNDDKHRALHVMVAAVGRGHHKITFEGCRHTSFRDPPAPPRVQPGAVVAHLTIVVTGANPTVEVQPDLHGYIALEGWTNAMDVLIDTRREVTEILNAPEILQAL